VRNLTLSNYGPKGKPIEVDAHDFEDKDLGKVVPYGVYDVGANSGYVSLGIGGPPVIDVVRHSINAAEREYGGGKSSSHVMTVALHPADQNAPDRALQIGGDGLQLLAIPARDVALSSTGT
jgi:hypothetical protein